MLNWRVKEDRNVNIKPVAKWKNRKYLLIGIILIIIIKSSFIVKNSFKSKSNFK